MVGEKMKKLKIIFMGTPIFSVPILKALIANYNISLVVTAPDAYIGRKKKLTPPPVKQLAIEYNIPVFSPVKISEDFECIKEINPDLIITCAYGQFISEEILNIPRFGCINIHASILPKYRGGAPIHHALINGETETGITLMYMDKGMDSGDIIISEYLKIEEKDNLESLSEKLSLLGTKMIIKYLPSIIDGTCKRLKQNEAEVTYARIIKREHELIDFHQTSDQVFNLFRALSPAPLPYFMMDNTSFKIAELEKVPAQGKISSIVQVDKNSFTIMCADGGVKITKIQPFGKKIMNVKDYFNGIKKETLLNKEIN